MPVQKNIPVNVTIETLLDQDPSFRYTPKIKKELKKAISLSAKLLQPAVAYVWVEVLDVKKDHIVYYDNQSNQTKALAFGATDYFQSRTQFILVSVASVGSNLDEKIRALNLSGDYLMAYLLDCIGVMALEQINTVVCSLAEKKAKRSGWGVSGFISPGAFDGWDLEGQKALAGLVSLDQIGVQLNPAGMMSPLKSVSGVIAIGTGFSDRKVSHICSTCNHASDCRKHNCQKIKEVIS